MTLRLAANPDDAPRPSARVDRVASILDCDPATVRKLLRRQKLQGHKVGSRAVRIYLDSVRAYQEGQPITGQEEEGPRQARRRATTAHREAVAYLRAHGIG